MPQNDTGGGGRRVGEAETYLGEKKWEDYRGGWSCSSVAAREGGGEMKRGRKTGERSEGTGSVAEKERRRGAGSKSDGNGRQTRRTPRSKRKPKIPTQPLSQLSCN